MDGDGNSDHGAVAHGLGQCGSHGGHATTEALMVSYSHGSHDAHGIHMSHSGAHSSFSPHGAAAQASAVGRQGDPKAQKRKFRESLKDGGKPESFIVHVSLHGAVDLASAFNAMAPKLNLVRVDGRRPGLGTIDHLSFELMDWDSWDPTSATGDKPSGMFPGATGQTAYHRQFWQVGKRKSLFGKPEYDPSASTYLEVSWLVWRFDQTGDYDTRLDVRVITIPVWDPAAGAYGTKREPVQTHENVAVEVCEHIFDLLTSTPPDEASKLLRQRVNMLYPGHEDDDSTQSIRVATDEEDHEAEMANMAREKGEDAWARAQRGSDTSSGGGSIGGDDDGDSLIGGFQVDGVARLAVAVPHED